MNNNLGNFENSSNLSAIYEYLHYRTKDVEYNGDIIVVDRYDRFLGYLAKSGFNVLVDFNAAPNQFKRFKNNRNNPDNWVINLTLKPPKNGKNMTSNGFPKLGNGLIRIFSLLKNIKLNENNEKTILKVNDYKISSYETYDYLYYRINNEEYNNDIEVYDKENRLVGRITGFGGLSDFNIAPNSFLNYKNKTGNLNTANDWVINISVIPLANSLFRNMTKKGISKLEDRIRIFTLLKNIEVFDINKIKINEALEMVSENQLFNEKFDEEFEKLKKIEDKRLFMREWRKVVKDYHPNKIGHEKGTAKMQKLSNLKNEKTSSNNEKTSSNN
jgi:hypothetical protein